MEDDTRLNSLYSEFGDALRDMDQPRSVARALAALESGETDLTGLYTKILAPILNMMTDAEKETEAWIWKEHIRSSIIRSVIECCSPFLQKELLLKGVTKDKGKVVIFSPGEEFHELGARMGADFFALRGYQPIFVGSNTPESDILAGLKIERPRFVVINVVNFLNIVKVKNMMKQIAEASPESRILVSGYAFRHDPDMVRRIGASGLIDAPEDIDNL